MNKNRDLTQGNIKKHIMRLTGPMVFGILGLTIFNLVDTYFVGLLGTNELAALSFTFPIVLTFSSLTLGISTGVTAVVSKAAGKSNSSDLKSLIFDSMLLSLICVILFVGIGFLILRPALNLMQADEEIIPIVMDYMVIWLPGLVFVVFPMVGNGIIRALGDAKTPGIVMLIAASVNAVFDPLFIFGIGPFPELGVAGAAIATLIGRAITFSVMLYVLMKRDRVLVLQKRKIKDMAKNWKEILTVALPAGLSRIILPLGSGIITGLIAVHGVASVAGFGIAFKVEGFTIIVASSLASIIIPFAGQNIGAKKFNRVRQMFSYSNKFVILLQGILFLLLLIFAPLIARLFSKDAEVIKVAALYLRIVSIAYGAKGVVLTSSALLNVMRRPMFSAAINLGQMFIIFVPFALLGNMMFGITGIFIALSLSLIITGGVAWKIADNRLKKITVQIN